MVHVILVRYDGHRILRELTADQLSEFGILRHKGREYVFGRFLPMNNRGEPTVEFMEAAVIGVD